MRDIYAERKELIQKYIPVDIQDAHARSVEDLTRSGIQQRALKPGDAAPNVELQDQNGQAMRSSEFLENGPLIICFFRGRWCPFCIGQMEAMNAILPELHQLGASLAGISPQTVHQSFLMADQHDLQFPLLSDADNQTAREFGIVYSVPDYQQAIYSRAFINLPFINGVPKWELPVPATFILGAEKGRQPEKQRATEERSQAKVLYASADPDYTVRPEPRELVEFIAQLLS